MVVVAGSAAVELGGAVVSGTACEFSVTAAVPAVAAEVVGVVVATVVSGGLVTAATVSAVSLLPESPPPQEDATIATSSNPAIFDQRPPRFILEKYR